MTSQQELLERYPVWDRTVRVFHWFNVLLILGMIAIGTVILNAKALGVSVDGKILLKTVHVYVGYAFIVNLSWRLIWGFIGNRYARWKAILPIGDQYKKQRLAFTDGIKKGNSVAFMGHNPLARWMVTLLFVLLSSMAVTGLVVGGTDVYMPPFGGSFKTWIAESPATVDIIKPYSDEGVNKQAYEGMREFRKPFITVHYYGFFILLGAIILHLLGAVVSEFRERNGLVSAMFTGEKVFKEKPIDMDD
ncbi:MAG: cytochrome b/b6 domain-containing protein [Candidatus Thiodiazotropha sp.]